jgi:processive 1,2-diacylglycerol beta-glucosyltransferase
MQTHPTRVTEPSGKRPILILTSAFGEGHNAAARNLAAALREQDPGRVVEVRDLFAEAYGLFYMIAQTSYFFFINHLPALWSWFFTHLHQSKEAPAQIAIFRRGARLLSRTISEINPSVIVSTYPGYNHLLDHLHGRNTRPYRMITVVTDSISINSLWYRSHSDLYLLPNEVTARVMEEAGVPANKLRVTGFPVPLLFETLRGRRAELRPTVVPKVLYLVNPGQKNAEKILKKILSVTEIEVSAACGRDENLRKSLQKIADSFSPPIRIEGWMNDLPERLASSHLIIAKAGGATVQECLASATPLVMSQIIPGQEEGNAELLISANCGCTATSPQAIATAVQHAFSHGAIVWKTWEANAWKTGKPDGARNAARIVLEVAEKDAVTDAKQRPGQPT